MKKSGAEAIDLANRFVKDTNADNFVIRDFDDLRLRVVGSFDLAYYHELEIVFIEPSFISLPTCFDNPVFRMASKKEIIELASHTDIDGSVFCIEEDPAFFDRKHYVVADVIEVEDCVVYYYAREDLKDGERVELPSKNVIEQVAASDR